MLITVALCTWNRAGLLEQTLHRMLELRIPEGIEWELIVVDNNSADDTEQVIERHANLLPIRRVFEPRQGLSIARNRAIDEASGELIVWTDDDVLVDPGWLAAYADAARRWPDASYFGGEILPWYEFDPPRWVDENIDHLQGMLVVRKLGDAERAFSKVDSPSGLPYGANMAFRRATLARHRFDPTRGSIGDRKIFGDETSLLTALHAEGAQGIWVPSAKVRHYIPATRTTVRFLKHCFFWHGRTLAMEESYPDATPLWGAPRFLYRRYWERILRAGVARILGRPEWVGLLIDASRDKGRIHELREQRARPRLAVSVVEVS